jgi:hypothetical protein
MYTKSSRGAEEHPAIGLEAPAAPGHHPARMARPAKSSPPCLRRRFSPRPSASPRSSSSRCRHPFPNPPSLMLARQPPATSRVPGLAWPRSTTPVASDIIPSPIVSLFTDGGQVGLELLDGMTDLVHEAAHVPRHARGLMRTEDKQRHERYEYQLLWTYAEHAISYKKPSLCLRFTA